MINIDATVRVRAALLAALTVCAACGGGGGGTVVGGGSPPAGPSSPPAPVVTARAVASATSVQEGQPFRLDASTSSEAGGAVLTYAWTQVSGPAVTIATPTSAVLDLNAAEVTADTKAEFSVTATSGAVSSAATVEVTFANIAQTPSFNGGPRLLSTATFTTPPRKAFGEYNYAMVGLAAGPGDAQTFVELTTSTSGELQVGAASQLENLPPASLLKVSSAPFGAGTERYFSLVEEAANRFRIMTRATTGQVDTKYSYALNAPCGFSHAIANGQLGYYVGQRQGFTVYRTSTLPPVNVGSWNTSKVNCALIAPRLSITGGTFLTTPGGAPFTPAYYDVITLDQDANTLTVYNDLAFGSTPSYLPKPAVPVQLNATRSLQLASWTEIGLNNGIGFTTAMALVFTDGVHNGEHRLVIVGLDNNRNLVQQTYNLGLGIPIQVFTDNMDGDSYQPEIVVLKSTSPQLEIYEPTVTGGVASSLAGPFFVEVGLGASSATRMRTMVGMNGTMIAFPDKKQIKLFDVPP